MKFSIQYIMVGFSALLVLSFQNCSRVGAYSFKKDGADPSASASANNSNNNNSQTIVNKSTSITVSSEVDILFVDDNSGSMSEEQNKMSTKFPNFISSLSSLDYRIAITTTDVSDMTDSNQYKDGNLISFNSSNLKFLDKTTPSANTLFQSAVNVGANGSGDERAIFAANRTVSKKRGTG